MKFLIIQTAFIGDVILTLPMVQVLKRKYTESTVDFICIPKTAPILDNNPYINEVIVYDKRGEEQGLGAFIKLMKEIRKRGYDTVISPHRYLRSTLISGFSGAKQTIAFDNSTLSGLYKNKVEYGKTHEIQRNLSLLKPLGIEETEIIKPELFPGADDICAVDKIISGLAIKSDTKFITAAPGSEWFTKRFPKDKFVTLFNIMDKSDLKIVLIGSKGDYKLCEYIASNSTNNNIYIYAGKLDLLQSAELIRRSALLITNDSAPLHIANAVGTKLIAIFGATNQDFGFYPYGIADRVFEISGLGCRPCSIHGGQRCPTGTFDCMLKIDEKEIADAILNKC